MLTEPLPLSRPGDTDWDEARRAWNLAVDQQPAAVARPRSIEEVCAAVAFARDHDLRITAQGTGHGAASLAPLDGTLLIRTDAMAAVAVDPERRLARVEAGAVWGDVTAAAGAHGLAALAGAAPCVGVVGYTLGGGIGWLSRRYGLAANSVHAIELVTAAGEVVRASHNHKRDLFWALRGGGGAFGVVCALELELFSVPSPYAGMLTFPAARAGEVLSGWRAWTARAGDAVTSTARIMELPPAPELPEQLRGRRLVVIDGADLRAHTAAATELAALRALGPEIDTFATVPVSGLVDRLHMGPYLGRPQPVPAVVEHALLDDLPADAIGAIVPAALAGLDAGLAMVELRHLGGALATAPPAAGALARLDAEYALLAVGLAMTPAAVADVDAAIDSVLGAAEPWSTGWAYPNFAERGLGDRAAFADADRRRLQAVKALHDPDDRVLAALPIQLPTPRDTP